MRHSSRDIITLAATVYGEARGSSQQDREDVAFVMLNRLTIGPNWMKSQRGDGIPDHTLEAVCRDPWQFSCWNANDPNRVKLDAILLDVEASLKDTAFRNSLEAALSVINGHAQNRVRQALHYHATWMSFPKAWGTKIAPIYENGHHLFYEGIQ